MEEFRTKNYRMWSQNPNFTNALFTGLGQMELNPNNFVSNINVYYENIYQSGLAAFTDFRHLWARMNNENQQYLMDIVTASGKYIGLLGKFFFFFYYYIISNSSLLISYYYHTNNRFYQSESFEFCT